VKKNFFLPGGLGRLPARGSHRPVRAFLMHTVPQIMDSLRLLPVAVSLTQYSNFDAFAVFPNNGSTIRRLASLHAVRAVPFPPFSGTIKALRLAAVLCAALRFLRLALPRGAP